MKTGGRQKGTPNKPKPRRRGRPPGGGGARAADGSLPAHARAREEVIATAPKYRPVRIDSLSPYETNARTHTQAQIDKIAASIREFGFTNPVLTDGHGGILAGHGRVLAAEQLGMTTVPAISLAYLSELQRRAYVIADNRLALDAGWDDELLALELGELAKAGFDLRFTGFEIGELAHFTEEQTPYAGAGSLAAAFGVPPFTVLNAREGWWQDRKRDWLALGIQSELGRGENVPTGETTLGAIASNERTIMKRTGSYAIPGGGPMPLDRAKNKRANATPGGSNLPAANYKTGKRGDGRGRAAS